jgi:hypothetical protein
VGVWGGVGVGVAEAGGEVSWLGMDGWVDEEVDLRFYANTVARCVD